MCDLVGMFGIWNCGYKFRGGSECGWESGSRHQEREEGQEEEEEEKDQRGKHRMTDAFPCHSLPEKEGGRGEGVDRLRSA